MAEIALKITLTPTLNAAALNVILAELRRALGPLGKDIGSIDASKLEGELEKVRTEAEKAAVAGKKLGDEMDGAAKKGSGLGKAFDFNQMVTSVNTITNALNEVAEAGVKFEENLKAVQAITGQTDEQMKVLGDSARNLAKEFGGSANDQLKSFQGILSKFGAQVADTPEALAKMAETINILSAASGDNAATSMAALTDTMLQMGLVSGDSAKDAETMVRVADALAASAQVGAAEIPQVKDAILQCGVAAKGANQDLGKTTATIQALAIGGKTGSEAGIALRNVLGLLQKASAPAEEAMGKLGTSSKELGKLLTEQGLDAALGKLKGGLDNVGTAAERNALMFTIFGTENSAAAGILIDNLGKIQEFEEGINKAVSEGGSNAASATAQAAVRMNTSATQIARVKAFVEDAFITLSQSLGQGVTTVISASSQLAPTITALSGIRQIIPAGAIDSVLNFGRSILGIIPSLFAQESATGAATGAQNALNASMLANPIGLTILAILALGAAFYVLYSKFQPFTDLVDSTFAGIKEGFSQLMPVFNDVADLLGLVGEVVYTMIITPFQLAGTVIGTIVTALFSLVAGAGSGGGAMKTLGTIAEFVSNALNFVKAGIEGFLSGLESLKSSAGNIISALATGNVVDIANAFLNAGSAAGDAFSSGAAESLDASKMKDAADSMSKSLEDSLKIKVKIDQAGSIDKLNAELEGAQIALKPLQLKVEAGQSLTADEQKQFDELAKKAAETGEKIKALAPEAVTGMKTIVNSTGELTQVYDFNTEAVKKVAAEQKKAFGAELRGEQEKYSAKLKDAVVVYEQQKVKLKELQDEAIKLGKAGKTDEAKQKLEEYKKLKLQFDANGAALTKGYSDGAKAGLLTFVAQEKVEGAMGITKGTADKLLDVQKKQEAAAKDTAAAVADIGKMFEDTLKAANEAVDGTAGKLKGLILQRQQLTKAGKDTSDLDKQIGESKKVLQTQDKERDGIKSISDEVEKLIENKKKSTKEAKSEFDIASKQFDETKKLSAERLKSFEIEERSKRLAEGREKTVEDDIILAEKKRESIVGQQQELSKLFKIGESGEIGIRLKTDEKSKAAEITSEVNNAVKESENDLTEVRLKIGLSEEELRQKIQDFRIDNLRLDVEIGTADNAGLLAALNEELDIIALKSEDATGKVLESLRKREADITKEIRTVKKTIYADQISELTDAQKREEDELQRSLNQQKTTVESSSKSLEQVNRARFEIDKKERLQQLEEQRRNSIINEEQFNLEKERVEVEFQSREQVIISRSAGFREAAEFASSKSELDLKKKHLQEKLKLARDNNDSKAAKDVEKQLSDVEKALAEKGDLLGLAVAKLNNSVGEGINNLLGGDFEGAKENLRNFLGMIAGFLEKLAVTAVLEIILNPTVIAEVTSTAGIFAPLALGAMQQLIAAGIHELINPLLSSILSFSAGGVVVNPTLAIVGDRAATAGGTDNTEFILGSDQMRAVITAAISQMANEMAGEIRALRSEIGQQRIVGIVKGEDINLINRRAEAQDVRRSRLVLQN